MIEIALQNVEIDFGFNKVLQSVSFVVQTGEKVALVGGNGSGKTTILRIITGLQKCDKGSCTLRKGANIGYLNQESDIGEADITVESYIKEAQQPVLELENKLRSLETRMSESAEDGKLDKLLTASKIKVEFLTGKIILP